MNSRQILVLSLFLPLILLFFGCDYARMRDQESIRTYEAEPPEMPAGTIPISGGAEVLKASKPADLRNPLANDQKTLDAGKIAYAYFCIHCHGQKFDGNGTVGQSFAPLPTDLKGAYVRQQSDGDLFYKISFGYKRHPPLSTTVSEQDRWAVLHYIRSIK